MLLATPVLSNKLYQYYQKHLLFLLRLMRKAILYSVVVIYRPPQIYSASLPSTRSDVKLFTLCRTTLRIVYRRFQNPLCYRLQSLDLVVLLPYRVTTSRHYSITTTGTTRTSTTSKNVQYKLRSIEYLRVVVASIQIIVYCIREFVASLTTTISLPRIRIQAPILALQHYRLYLDNLREQYR